MMHYVTYTQNANGNGNVCDHDKTTCKYFVICDGICIIDLYECERINIVLTLPGTRHILYLYQLVLFVCTK